MKALPPVTEMRRAFLHGDASYDGVFYTGVRTTGIFCRPSCTARKPRPENAEFFATPREASFSGYRPCKRCRPLDADGRPPAWVQRLLSRIDADPSRRIAAGDLRAAGIDPARARRHFLQHYGMIFQAYCRARRLGDAFRMIREGAAVSEAASGSGFESESGFRAAFARAFGTTPAEAAGADAILLDWNQILQRLGELPIDEVLAHDGGIVGQDLAGLELQRQAHILARRLEEGIDCDLACRGFACPGAASAL